MYGTVASVAEAFDPQQWDPTRHEPDTATVTSWLERWSDVLDGEIGHIVETPVDSVASPKLTAILERITCLRAQADVAEHRHGQAGTEKATAWRNEAHRLVQGIRSGGKADGSSLGGRTPDDPGAVDYDFGSGANVFSRDQKF